MSRMVIWGIEGIGEIVPGDQIGDVIVEACRQAPNGPLLDNDVVVVTQKIVSKAEGRLVQIDPDDPVSHKQLVEQEAVRIVRRRGDLIITETKHGFVCANSGVDLSNVERSLVADRQRPLGATNPKDYFRLAKRTCRRHCQRHLWSTVA